MIFYEEVTLGNLHKAVLSHCLVSDVTFRLFSFLLAFFLLNRRLERYKRRLNNFIVWMKNTTKREEEKGVDANTKIWSLEAKVIERELVRKHDK